MGAVRLRLNVRPLPINNGNNPKGEVNKQGKQHMVLRNKGKQTNKQIKRWHVQGCGYKGQCDVIQSLEFATQCVRVCMQHVGVCGKALEVFRSMWSLAYEVVL